MSKIYFRAEGSGEKSPNLLWFRRITSKFNFFKFLFVHFNESNICLPLGLHNKLTILLYANICSASNFE